MAMSWPQVMSVVAGRQQRQREHRQRKRRRIEDVGPSSVLVPADALLRREADGDHEELEVEPVRLEPEKEVGAEDDRERAEPERIRVAPRPGEQHVERVGEQQLGDDQVGVLVDRRPVPSPVQEDRRVRAGLHVVLGARNDLEDEDADAAPRGDQQDEGPCQQDRGAAENRPEQPVVLENRLVRGTTRPARPRKGWAARARVRAEASGFGECEPRSARAPPPSAWMPSRGAV